MTPARWPALMRTATAAEYLDMSEGSLLALLHRHDIKPADTAPLRLKRWRREDLDRVAGVTADLTPAAEVTAPQVDAAAQALLSVRSRSQGRGVTRAKDHEERQPHH